MENATRADCQVLGTAIANPFEAIAKSRRQDAVDRLQLAREIMERALERLAEIGVTPQVHSAHGAHWVTLEPRRIHYRHPEGN